MDIKNKFWEDIAHRLSQDYILNSLPSTWKKGEIQTFIEHFREQVIQFRTECDMDNALDVKLSYDTFRRILIKGETKGSDYTRTIFAQYFGEESYASYVEKLNPDQPKKTSSKKKLLTLAALLIVFLVSVSSIFLSNQLNKDVACDELKMTIANAIQAEMSSYRSVPNYEQSSKKLKDYFSDSGHAYKKIEKVLTNVTKRGWVLSNPNNISTAQLLESSCEYIDENLATMRTKEHWVIQWYDTNTNEYAYLYDTINTQIYYLKKDTDNIWKITINNYDSNKNNVFVKIFEDEAYDKTISFSKLKSKINNFLSLGDTQSALWWLAKYAETHSFSSHEDIILLQGEVNNNIRRVNTKQLDLSTYYELNKNVDHKILNFLNEPLEDNILTSIK